MNIIAAWRARCAANLTELEQAALRPLLIGAVVFFVWWFASRDDEHVATTLLTGLAASFAVAIGIFSSIWISPAPSVARRVLGMFSDVGLVTFALFLAGQFGVMLVGLYLFFIFSNGLRFGRVYHYISQAFCLVGFVLVLSMVPWWRHAPLVGAAFLVLIIAVPFYVEKVTHALNQARLNAEQAFNESVERERVASIRS